MSDDDRVPAFAEQLHSSVAERLVGAMPEPAVVVDAEGRPIVKATKCDLCVEQLGGPACARACPHDALRRVSASVLVEQDAAAAGTKLL